MKKNELKCTDLRIGNLIDYFGYIVKVDTLEFFDGKERVGGINTTEGDRVFDKPSYFEPIELTEELLLKIRFTIELTEDVLVTIGLKKGDTAPTHERYYLEVCGNGQSLFLSYDFYYDGQRRLKITFRNLEGVENEFKKYDIKYIHELQNAYYLLTNEELGVEL